MVGLSIVLEARNCSSSGFVNEKSTPKVINKATLMVISKPYPPPPSSPATFRLPTFLENCFLCRQKLLPGKDIYMYKGDRAFCSVECRCKQIFMDEEETLLKDNCSLAANKPSSTAASGSSTASSHGSSHRKNSTRNRAGGFVY